MKLRFKRLISAGLTVVMTAASITLTNGAVIGDSSMLPYQDESLSFEERAADLVSRMTLEEKVAQLGHSASAISRLGVKKILLLERGSPRSSKTGTGYQFPFFSFHIQLMGP